MCSQRLHLEILGIGHLTDYSEKEKNLTYHCNEEPKKKKIKLPSPVWSVMYFCFKNLLIPDKPEF